MKFIKISIQYCKNIIKKINNLFLRFWKNFDSLIFIIITYVLTNEFYACLINNNYDVKFFLYD